MTEAIYLTDSYAKEYTATVQAVDGKFITLDKTIFYPVSGGQASDTGVFKKDEEEFKVIFVKKIAGNISHEVDKAGLQVGDTIQAIIDWPRRYKLMRSHTAMHVLTKTFHNETKVLITGNQIEEEKARVDLNLELFDREVIDRCFVKANELFQKDIQVKSYFMKKDEAFQDETLVRLASRDFLEKLGDNIRIVEIVNVDKQLDGGTHVKSLKEVGQIKLTKLDNKGKGNRRIYFTVESA